MEFNMTDILRGVVYLLAAVASTFLIPWLKAKVGAEKMADFLKWVDIAVAAAEQLYDSANGQQKKQFVLAYLEEKGFVVSEDELNMAIEAAVNKLHNELYGKGEAA